MALAIQMAMAQELSPKQLDELTIQGIVIDAGGKPVGDALVRLEQKDVPSAREIRTNAVGVLPFRFSKAVVTNSERRNRDCEAKSLT
jgi:hypothetical protein